MPSAISAFIPRPRLRETDRVAVAADPAATWNAARGVDLYELDFTRALFEIRALPDQVSAWVHGRHADPTPKSMPLDEVFAPGAAFHLLAEVPGNEIVVGAIGKFWKLHIPFVNVSPLAFAAFGEPGYGKVAWALQVHPRVGGGSWLGVDLRVDATDEQAWCAFRPYWALIGRFSHMIRRGLLRELATRLGHPSPDADRALVGDEILPRAGALLTHAVTIEARPKEVWPWLAQMGGRRAGWYSVDALDNDGAPSAERIVPELQHIAVGDVIPATPYGDDGFAVLAMEPDRALILGSPSLLPGARAGARKKDEAYRMTWSFVLEPIDDVATHLVVRVRGELAPGVRAQIARAALTPAHAIMERAQLRGIKRRAEHAVPVERRLDEAAAGTQHSRRCAR